MPLMLSVRAVGTERQGLAAMFGLFFPRSKAEAAMAEWLAHPNEFGVPPSRVTYRRTVRGSRVGSGKTRVHLVDYEMPDGTKGLGFVGPAVWSFCEPDILLADEADVLKAYMGLLFVLAGIESGCLETNVVSKNCQDEALVSMLTSKGYSDVMIGDRSIPPWGVGSI